MMLQDYDYLWKLVVVGDTRIGKSCLISRIVDDIYTNSYQPTIGFDYFDKLIKIKQNSTHLAHPEHLEHLEHLENLEKKVLIRIYDTGGTRIFQNLNKKIYDKMDGVIFAFDVTKIDSFIHLQEWINTVYSRNQNIVGIIVGTKFDLITERQVSYDNALEFANNKGLKYFETSSKESLGLSNMFEAILDLVVNKIFELPKNNKDDNGIQNNDNENSDTNNNDNNISSNDKKINFEDITIEI